MTDPAERLYERVLLLRCQAGDDDAFAELVERYSARLGYFLRKMLGDGHAADDALQDVWFDVFRGLGQLNDLAAFPAWVYRIARDRVARKLRRHSLPLATLADSEAVGSDDNNDFSAEDAAAVHVALDRLAPEQREILVLRFLEDMPYDDIARVVGCPVGTVRSRLHYAKLALRKILERTDQHE